MADYATLVLDIDSGPARTAATDLAKFNQAAIKAGSGADKLNKTLRDSNGRFRSTVSVAKEYGAEVQSLAAKYNPALSAAYEYQQTQVELNRAVALGVVTQSQADDALSAYVARANGATTAANNLARAQRGNAAATANVFAQLNDISVMMAAGQNPFQLAMQQGMQLNQVWAAMGEEGKKLSGVGRILGASIMTMVSPMNLLTIGVIAGTAALTQWIFSSDDAGAASKNLNEKTYDLAASINDYAKAAKLARQSAAGLTEEYGAQFAAASSVLKINAELAKEQIFKDLAVSATEMSSQFQNIVGYVTMYDHYIAKGVEGQDVAARQARLLREEFGLTVDQARSINVVLDEMLAANTPEVLAQAMSRFAAEVARAAKGNVDVSQSLRDAAVSANSVADAVLKATGATGRAIGVTNQWANAMMGVRSAVAGILSGLNAISGQAISFASAEAELKALKAGSKAADARHAGEVRRIELEGVERGKQLTRELGLRGKIQATMETAANLALLTKERELTAARELAAEREKEAGGSGGGAALRQAEKQFQTLSEFLEKESLFQVAEYQKRQEQLDNALAKNLLSIQTYETMKQQLQTFYFGTEYQQKALNYTIEQQQLDAALAQRLISEERHAQEVSRIRAQQQHDALSGYQKFFGNMAQAAQAGGDRATGIVKAFSIAQGLLNSYLAFTQVLADPALVGRPFLRTALAYSTLAAGLGQVAAMRGGGSSGKGASGSTSTSAVTKQQAQQWTFNITGDDWAVGMVENIIEQMQEQQQDGLNLIVRRNT